jgi:carbonic anhydrase/acetyltransferase-like protein (isoleucine patch superfamily)
MTRKAVEEASALFVDPAAGEEWSSYSGLEAWFVSLDGEGAITHVVACAAFEPGSSGGRPGISLPWLHDPEVQWVHSVSRESDAVSFLLEAIAEVGLRTNPVADRLGHVQDVFGRWHSLDALPDDLRTHGRLALGATAIPPRLHVSGDVLVYDGGVLVVPPEAVAGTLIAEDFARVVVEPGTRIQSFMFRGVGDVELPEDVIAANLTFDECGPVDLPRKVIGTVQVNDVPVRRFGAVTGDLSVGHPAGELPANLQVGGTLHLSEVRSIGPGARLGGLEVSTNVKSGFDLGKGCFVRGMLQIHSGQGPIRIGDGLSVGGCADLVADAIRIGSNCTFGDAAEIVFGTIVVGKGNVCMSDLAVPDGKGDRVEHMVVAGRIIELVEDPSDAMEFDVETVGPDTDFAMDDGSPRGRLH